MRFSLSLSRPEPRSISHLGSGAFASPEIELLLALVRLDPGPGDRLSHLLRQDLDWVSFQELAIAHGVLPHVYHGLGAYSHAIAPQHFSQLRHIYLLNARRNLSLAGSLIRILEGFSSQGIPAICLKGPALALLAYGDLSRRHFVDLDILIRPEDFQRALPRLADLGWRDASPGKPRSKTWLLRSEKDLAFTSGADRLDLHWNIAEPGMVHAIPLRDWWQNLQTVPLLDRQVHTLSFQNTLLFLCLHGAKHSWRELKTILDLAYFISANPARDWPAALERVRAAGLSRALSVGQTLSQRFCGLDLPDSLQDAIPSDRKTQQLAAQVAAGLRSGGPSPSMVADSLFYLRSRERLRDRLYYIYDQALLPKQADWLAFSLPKSLYPLYYLLRPLRLAYKFLLRPLVRHSERSEESPPGVSF
jgi:hypothetical protein